MSSLRILASAFLLHGFSSFSKASTDKVGAGLFLLNDEFAGGDPHVLLLKRSKETNNPKTWSLPGGNYDAQLDRDLYETALREAREELGGIPDITSVRGSILVKWGNDNDNEYTVFVVETVRVVVVGGGSDARSLPPFLPSSLPPSLLTPSHTLVRQTANNGTWRPDLDGNEQHTDSKWINLKDLEADSKGIELHPALEKLTGYTALDILRKLEFNVTS